MYVQGRIWGLGKNINSKVGEREDLEKKSSLSLRINLTWTTGMLTNGEPVSNT